MSDLKVRVGIAPTDLCVAQNTSSLARPERGRLPFIFFYFLAFFFLPGISHVPCTLVDSIPGQISCLLAHPASSLRESDKWTNARVQNETVEKLEAVASSIRSADRRRDRAGPRLHRGWALPADGHGS